MTDPVVGLTYILSVIAACAFCFQLIIIGANTNSSTEIEQDSVKAGNQVISGNCVYGVSK